MFSLYTQLIAQGFHPVARTHGLRNKSKVKSMTVNKKLPSRTNFPARGATHRPQGRTNVEATQIPRRSPDVHRTLSEDFCGRHTSPQHIPRIPLRLSVAKMRNYVANLWQCVAVCKGGTPPPRSTKVGRGSMGHPTAPLAGRLAGP